MTPQELKDDVLAGSGLSEHELFEVCMNATATLIKHLAEELKVDDGTALALVGSSVDLFIHIAKDQAVAARQVKH